MSQQCQGSKPVDGFVRSVVLEFAREEQESEDKAGYCDEGASKGAFLQLVARFAETIEGEQRYHT